MGSELGSGAIPVFFKVTIVNESTETHTLNWEEFPLKVAKVLKKNGPYAYHPFAEIKLSDTYINPEGSDSYWSTNLSMPLWPHAKRTMHFYWECDRDGIYLASVSAPLPVSIQKYISNSDEDRVFDVIGENYKKRDYQFREKMNFSVSKYFQVRILGNSNQPED